MAHLLIWGEASELLSDSRAPRNTEEVQTLGEVLASLTADFRMAIVTTARRVDFDLIHAERDIVRHFEFTLTVEDYARAKPHPDPYQAALINKSRQGSMLLAGQTVFILETQPALYAVLAANEAEKASRVTLVDIRPFGNYGRLYLAGEEADVVVGSEAAIAALEARQ